MTTNFSGATGALLSLAALGSAVAANGNPVEGNPIPTIRIGEEVSGDVANGAGRMFGSTAPAGVYRFSGVKGQTYCARVVSPDAYVHLYIQDANQPKRGPIASSWVPGVDHPRSDPTPGNALKFTVPRDGEYELILQAHQEIQRTPSYTKRYTLPSYIHSLPAGRGAYEAALWDANSPEPAWSLRGLAKTRPTSSEESPYVGQFSRLVGRVLVDHDSATLYRFAVQDGELVQHRQTAGGQALAPIVFKSTGERGKYHSSADGSLFEVQCDGTMVRHTRDGQLIAHDFWEDKVHLGRLDRHPLNGMPTQSVAEQKMSVTQWLPPTAQHLASAQEMARMGREEDERTALSVARRAAEKEALSRQVAAGIAGAVTTLASDLREQQEERQRAADMASQAQRAAQRQRDQAAGTGWGVATAPSSGSGGSGSGIVIEDRSAPTATAQPEAEPATRQEFAWCMALKDPRGILYSTVQQITIPYRGWSNGAMTQRFQSAAGGGVTVCMTADTQAMAQSQMDGSKRNYSGRQQTTVTTTLQP